MSRPVATGSRESPGANLYDRFLAKAGARPDSRIRFRGPDGWRLATLAELRLRVEQLAAALAGYGLGPGAPLAVLTPDGHEGLTGELAALACGASSVPLDPGLPQESIRDALRDSSAAVAVVSTPEVLEHVREIRPDLDRLELVLLFRPGISEGATPATTVETVCSWGAETLVREPEILLEARSGVDPFSPVVSLYVGSSVVELDTAVLLDAAGAVGRAVQIDGRDRLLIGAPFTDPGFRAWCWAALLAGADLALVEGNAPTIADCRGFRPTLIVARREAVRDLRDRLAAEIGAMSGIGSAVAKPALRAGRESAEVGLAGGRVDYRRTWKLRLADLIVLGRVRRAAGGALRFVVSTDGPVSRDVGDFFVSTRMPVLEGIAAPAAAGMVAMNRPDSFRQTTLGRPVPGLEIRVGPDHEIEIRPPGSDAAADGGPWRGTGLRGRLDDAGFLIPV
jgi:long-chain acyl-CoA synthetase